MMILGLLYDPNLSNYPLVTNALWWQPTAVTRYILNAEIGDEPVLVASLHATADLIQRVTRLPLDIVVCSESMIPIDTLDGLLVFRSHPEMFGPEIHAFRQRREAVLSCEIYTVERYD